MSFTVRLARIHCTVFLIVSHTIVFLCVVYGTSVYDCVVLVFNMFIGILTSHSDY